MGVGSRAEWGEEEWDKGGKATSVVSDMRDVPLSHILALLQNQLHSKFMCSTVNRDINSKKRFISSPKLKVSY